MSNQAHKPHWQEIAETQSPHELSQGHLFWLWAYRIGITGSFAALATFIVERMAGTNATIWDWTAGQYLYGGIGLVFAFAFSMFVYGFYLSEYTIKKRLFMFLVVVSFPLFAEVSQTMYRGEEATIARSQASPEFLAAQKALDRMAGANPTAVHTDGLVAAQGDKARHQAELAACARYSSPVRRAKCERYEQGKIAEADGRLSGYNTASTAAATAHKADIHSTIIKIGELGNNQQHAHAMVKMLMQVFGWSLLIASLVMAILIIGSIETALSWLGGQVKDYQKAMRARGLEIGSQKHDVVRFQHDTGNPAPVSTSAPVTSLHGLAKAVGQAVQDAPVTIGNEMMMAQAAREQLNAKTADMLGNLGSKLDNRLYDWVTPEASDLANVRESGGFKQSPEQLARVRELAANPQAASTYREELRNGSRQIHDQPLDVPTATKPANQKPGRTGLQNPALGSAEEHYPLPLSTGPEIPGNVRAHSGDTHMPNNVRAHPTGDVRAHSADKSLLDAVRDAQSKIDPETLKDAQGLYEVWKAALLAGEPVLSARGGRAFINVKLCQARKKTITPAGMDALLAIWKKRGAREGTLMPNPKYTGKPPHPEYLIAT